jgi:outer membrane protein
MFQPSWPIVLTILSALLVGCATSSIEMAPDQPDRPWVPATNAAGEIIPGEKASPEQSAGATHVLPANSELAEVPSPFGLDRARTYSLV